MSDTHSHPHSHEQSRHRISNLQEYLGEFVYGGIDGCVTTFAVVAGSAGADLSVNVVLILGFANLLADGFSMSVGAYLSTQSDRDQYFKHERIEYQEIEEIPEMERQEVREIYQRKGFEGELLEQVVDVITADKDRWVDEMMKNELEMVLETKSPLAIGGITFLSFVLVGLIPMLAYLFDWGAEGNSRFMVACVLTSLGFALVGWLKAYINHTSRLRSVLETLFLGGSAAAVSYFVGDVLARIITG